MKEAGQIAYDTWNSEFCSSLQPSWDSPELPESFRDKWRRIAHEVFQQGWKREYWK